MKHSSSKGVVTGQALYNLPIPGDWNKGAVKQINDGVLAGIATTDLSLANYNWTNRLSLALLIEGSLVILDKHVTPGVVLFIDETELLTTGYQLVKLKTGSVLKVWEMGAKETTVSTYASPPASATLDELQAWIKDAKQPKEPDTFTSAGVVMVDNGRGILVPGEATLNRIKELSDLLAEALGPDALQWLVTNYAADISAFNTKAKAGGKFGTAPDGTVFIHAYDTGFVNDAFASLDRLVPAFKDVASNFVVVPGESGIARFLGLQGYINKVKHTQAIIVHVFAEYDDKIVFDNVIFKALLGEVQGAAQPTEAQN